MTDQPEAAPDPGMPSWLKTAIVIGVAFMLWHSLTSESGAGAWDEAG